MALVGVVMSAVSLYYYFRLVYFMYLHDGSESAPEPFRTPSLIGALVVCAVMTLALGLAPGPFLELARGGLGVLP